MHESDQQVLGAANFRVDPRCQTRFDRAWRHGSDIHLYEVGDTLAGYVVIRAEMHGWHERRLELREIVARDHDAARALWRVTLETAQERHHNRIAVVEAPDSAAGQVAREIGCDVLTTYQAAGGGMAAILDRPAFVAAVSAELDRRARCAGIEAVATKAALVRLRGGTLIPDDGALLRLTLGYQRYDDLDLAEPEDRQVSAVCRAWFPGGGGTVLPLGVAHEMDEY